MDTLHSSINAYFFHQNLAFRQPLPFESSGKQLNSKTTLYASNNLKNSSTMRQLSLIDLWDALESQSAAAQADLLEKQSNISSNITASNNASEEVARAIIEEERICRLLLQWRNIKSQYPDAVLLWCSLSVLSVFSQWKAREKGFAFARVLRRISEGKKSLKLYWRNVVGGLLYRMILRQIK